MRKILSFICLFSAAVTAADFPIVIDPVINATPPGAKVSAGYFTLVNESDSEITITGAYSTTITKIEIHLSSVENDVAKMVKQYSISIDAGATLRFEHGGYHLMLMGLTKPLKEDDVIDVILTTSAGEMLIDMPVRKMGMTKSKAKHSDVQQDGNDHSGPTKVIH